MATYSSSPRIDDIGMAPPRPPARDGGGDGSSGDPNNVPNYGARLRRARLGIICAIATVCMVFISLTSAYVFRRGLPEFDGAQNTYVRDWGMVNLPWSLLIANTVILLASSVTMELARRSSARQAALAQVSSIPGVSLGNEKSFPWLGSTVVLGFCFLAGQWMVWTELHRRGFYVATNPISSFLFLLTITHAVHLVGGIIALVWASSASLLRRPVESRRIAVDVSAWYWHFMAVLWIYVFGLLGFVR